MSPSVPESLIELVGLPNSAPCVRVPPKAIGASSPDVLKKRRSFRLALFKCLVLSGFEALANDAGDAAAKAGCSRISCLWKPAALGSRLFPRIAGEVRR